MKQVTRLARFRCSPALLLGFVLCTGSVLSVAAASAQQPQPPQKTQQVHSAEFPDGPGKDTFIRVCSKCHSPNNVIANGQNQQGWEDTITKMVGFGATGTDEEFSEILAYLVKNYPPPSAARH